MARFMLFSRLKSSIFPGVYARSNPAPLSGILQLSRNRSTSTTTSCPLIPLQPAIRSKPSVWIDVKVSRHKHDKEDYSWADLAKKIYDNLPVLLGGEEKPTVILSGSSVTAESHVCSYPDGIYANTVSIYTTLDSRQDGKKAEQVVDGARKAVLDYLDGETFVKINYHQGIYKAKTQY